MSVLEKEAPVDLQEQLIRRAWEDEQFADLLRTNPRLAIAEETGVELPGDVDIHVHQEDETTFHLVVPAIPAAGRDECTARSTSRGLHEANFITFPTITCCMDG